MITTTMLTVLSVAAVCAAAGAVAWCLAARRPTTAADAQIIDLASYEPRPSAVADDDQQASDPPDNTLDLRAAQTWHIGPVHPSMGFGAAAPLAGPQLTVIDGGGETTDVDRARAEAHPLRVVDADPHAYFELINLMDWADHRDPSPN